MKLQRIRRRCTMYTIVEPLFNTTDHYMTLFSMRETMLNFNQGPTPFEKFTQENLENDLCVYGQCSFIDSPAWLLFPVRGAIMNHVEMKRRQEGEPRLEVDVDLFCALLIIST